MAIGALSKKPKKVETVLGIDASTQSVAFCLYDKNGPVRWGEIKFKGTNTFERIGDANAKVRAAFADIDPDLICFEAATFVQSRETVILLSYAFGSILGAIMKPGVLVEKIPPITWQNAIGNKAFTKEEKADLAKQHPDRKQAWLKEEMRRLRKQRTMDWVKSNFGIDVPNDNVSDAIAVAKVGYDKFAS